MQNNNDCKQNAKNIKILSSLVSVGAAAVIAGVGVGCYYGGRAAGRDERAVAMSYVSTDSRTYSTVAELVKYVADSVVEIRTESTTVKWGMQYIVSGAGSGVIVGKNADMYYIVTNNHVVDGANDITVTLRSDSLGGSGVSYDARLAATDVAGDIAVITIEAPETQLNVATWGDSDDLCVGEDLVAIGNPLGSLGGTVTKGILSATGRSIAVGNYTMTLLQTDTAINPGNSGGGLFNMKGDLVGIVNAKTSDEEIEGICFAIPANTAREICEELITKGYVEGRSTLGITLTENNSTVYVSAVGDVADGTFMLYDKIHSINGVAVTSVLEYNNILATIEPGDNVAVEVFRGRLMQTYFGNQLAFETTVTEFEVTAKQIK